jgi:hypothetical protein
MKIENIKTESLVPYARNAKLHDESQVSKIASSIREFGFNNPVLVDGEKPPGIIAGHGRVLAAKKLGLTEVPCIRLAHLSEAHKRAYILADNRLAELGGGWDAEMLKLELADLGELDVDLEGIGFWVDDLADMELDMGDGAGKGEVDAEPQIDKAEELREKWGVQTGQLWQLGDHRILCGDSINAEDVARVMGGQKWGVAVIDPPFERNDLPHLSDPCIVFGQAKHIRLIPDSLWRFERVIDKVTAHRSATVQVGHRHAFVAQCGTVKKLPEGSDTYPSIIVCEDRPDHRHQKSVELLVEHLTVWTPPFEIAFDPFSGSGTTIIACEQLGRKCRAIEISPGYVAVAIQRWADATGKEPKLIK